MHCYFTVNLGLCFSHVDVCEQTAVSVVDASCLSSGKVNCYGCRLRIKYNRFKSSVMYVSSRCPNAFGPFWLGITYVFCFPCIMIQEDVILCIKNLHNSTECSSYYGHAHAETAIGISYIVSAF